MEQNKRHASCNRNEKRRETWENWPERCQNRKQEKYRLAGTGSKTRAPFFEPQHPFIAQEKSNDRTVPNLVPTVETLKQTQHAKTANNSIVLVRLSCHAHKPAGNENNANKAHGKDVYQKGTAKIQIEQWEAKIQVSVKKTHSSNSEKKGKKKEWFLCPWNGNKERFFSNRTNNQRQK